MFTLPPPSPSPPPALCVVDWRHRPLDGKCNCNNYTAKRAREIDSTCLLLDIVASLLLLIVRFTLLSTFPCSAAAGNSQSGAAAPAGSKQHTHTHRHTQMLKSNNSKTQQSRCRKGCAGASEHTRVAHVARTVRRARANYNFYCCQKQINANKLFVALCAERERNSPACHSSIIIIIIIVIVI